MWGVGINIYTYKYNIYMYKYIYIFISINIYTYIYIFWWIESPNWPHSNAVLKLITENIVQMLPSFWIYIFVFIFFKFEVALMFLFPEYYYWLMNTYKIYTMCWMLLSLFAYITHFCLMAFSWNIYYYYLHCRENDPVTGRISDFLKAI